MQVTPTSVILAIIREKVIQLNIWLLVRFYLLIIRIFQTVKFAAHKYSVALEL